nr:putative reverse transcriptase domain-containing protein [Tanacetum cinerariifolium]
MSSSTVTYTSVYTDSNPWRFQWVSDDELEALDVALKSSGQAPPSPDYVTVPSDAETPMEDQPLPDDASRAALSPGYIADSDLEEGPKEDPTEGGDDADDESSDDDDDDVKKDEEEEEHLASADSSVVPTVDPFPSAEDTEIFETDDEYAFAPTPPSSLSPLSFPLPHIPLPPLLLSSPPTTSPTYDEAPLGYKAVGIRLRVASPSTHHPSDISSPPLLLPSTSHIDDTPEADMSLRKRACFTTPTPRFKVGDSYLVVTARHARETWSHSKNCSKAVHAEIQAYRAHVNTHEIQIQTWDTRIRSLKTLVTTLVAQTSSLQTWLTLDLGRIQTLEARVSEPARDPKPQDGPADGGVTDVLAEIKANITSRNGDDGHDSGTGSRRTERAARECTYSDFLKCQPLNFKGTERVVGLTQWFEKMESVFDIKLALMCDKMFPKESDEVEKYAGGLLDMIQERVMTSKPKTMQDAIEFKTELMDQKIHTLAKPQAENKRKDKPELQCCHGYVPPKQSNNAHESRLNIISCTKMQKYLLKGCHVFLEHVTAKKAEDKSEEKRLEDVPIVQDFPEVFLEDFSVILPTRQVVFQIDLIPGVAPVARTPYRLDPSEMKELLNQLQELSDKGFIRLKIAKSMTKLTQKKVKFDWGDKQEAAFQLLKEKLCSTPILALLEGAENFIVYYDASHKGLGDVLMQNEKVISYASRQVKIHDKSFTIHVLELGAMVFALKIWRHYLYGTKCTVFTDHKGLQRVLDQKELNMRQLRWLELLSDYDCEIRYHLGKANQVFEAQTKARKLEYLGAEDVGGTNPNSNVVTGTFLLNNRYALILFDTGSDRSFVNNAHESRLNIISCTKMQKYLLKGCHVFLEHVTAKKAEDKSEEKRLEDVPIVQDFPEVFLEDFSVILPTRQVVFQIDLIPGVAPVARTPYRLDPSEMKELLNQLQELSDKGFIRLKIAKSMTKLTQKKVKFDWGDKQEAAFQLLKEKLCSTPILALLEGAENFIVYYDASHKGLGDVLMQNEKVISYASRQVKIHDKSFTIHVLELGAMVFALKIWRHYLYGTKCTVFTDHKGLQRVLDQKELNMRQLRWLELLSDYDCEIRYHLGKANVVADALSRKE